MTSEIEAEPETRSWLYHPTFPAGWTPAPLYSLATWVNGLAFRDIQFTKVGKPVIKIAEIKGGITGQTKFTTQTFDEKVRVRRGDMLFSWSGQPETSIDVFRWDGPEGWLNQHVFKLTAGEKLLPNFLFYLLRYLKPNFVAIAKNKQTTGLGHVTKRDLERMSVAYPTKDEQREIVAVLAAIDGRIDALRRINATLEEMAQALFQSWFVDFDPVRAKAAGTEPSGIDAATAEFFPDRLESSEIGEVPDGWTVKPLPDLMEVNPRRSLSKGTIAPYLDMKNLPTQGHTADEVVEREFSSGTKFQNGDTLLARITPCLENGKTGFVDFLQDGQIGWGSTEYIVFCPKAPLPKQFGYLLARSERLRAHAIKNMTGTSGRQRVPAECFNAFLLVMPTTEVVERFGELIEPIFTKIKTNADESRTLTALRDALLPKLMSGELSPAQSNKEGVRV